MKDDGNKSQTNRAWDGEEVRCLFKRNGKARCTRIESTKISFELTKGLETADKGGRFD